MDFEFTIAFVAFGLELTRAILAARRQVAYGGSHKADVKSHLGPALSLLATGVAVIASLATGNYDACLTIRQQEVCKTLLEPQESPQTRTLDCAKSVEESERIIDSVRVPRNIALATWLTRS